MKPVTQITARTGQPIVDGALEKLAQYAAELGLAVKQEGRWSYYRDGTTLQLKIQFVVGGEAGLEDKARTEFELLAWRYNLNAEDFGAIVTSRGRKFKLIGFNTKARRYPYLFEDLSNGDKIRFSDMAYAQIIAARGK